MSTWQGGERPDGRPLDTFCHCFERDLELNFDVEPCIITGPDISVQTLLLIYEDKIQASSTVRIRIQKKTPKSLSGPFRQDIFSRGT